MARRGDQSRGGAVRLQPTFGPTADISRSIALPKFRKPPKLKPPKRTPWDDGDGCGPGRDEEPEVIVVPPPTPPLIVGFSEATTPPGGANPDTGFNLIIPAVAGVQDGDLLIAMTVRQSGTPLTPPAGWSILASSGGSVIYQYTAAASEPSSYTWVQSIGDLGRSGVIVAIRVGAVGAVAIISAGTTSSTACPDVVAGSLAGALWLGFVGFPDPQNTADFTATGAHAIQAQHTGCGSNPGQSGRACAISTQAGLLAGETVGAGNAFVNNDTVSLRRTASLIINPVS